ncbi:MAG: DNA mismatch repair protein MutL, partial [Firmicutes bacterium HGW-Firmicutes-3]
MGILLLDQNTINKIAAGEVVERPASVIKELVENAIDAKADAITIEVKEGGLKFIRITDNGFGIHKEDVRAAFLRHSTSKIKNEEDLASIMSLGFRGEALASIASVGRVELITKQEAELVGIRYVIEGGVEKVFEEVGCPIGTTFIVKDLFYNTPARRKFMKTSGTELGYISDLVHKLALGHPEVSFKFISDGKIKLQTTGNNKLKDCIFSVYGMEVAKNLIEINWSFEGMRLEGFIGKPHLSRGNRTYENYFLNGRYIKSKVIERAIEDGYKSK